MKRRHDRTARINTKRKEKSPRPTISRRGDNASKKNEPCEERGAYRFIAEVRSKKTAPGTQARITNQENKTQDKRSKQPSKRKKGQNTAANE